MQTLNGVSAQICQTCGAIDAPHAVRPKEGTILVTEQSVSPIHDSLGILKALLYLGVTERVSKVTFEPTPADYVFTVLSDGIERELEPPPPHLHRQIVALACCLWQAVDNQPEQDRTFLRVVVPEQPKLQTSVTLHTQDAGTLVAIKFEFWE